MSYNVNIKPGDTKGGKRPEPCRHMTRGSKECREMEVVHLG